MILFCGIPSEPPIAMAIAAAEEAGIEHVVLNQRQSQYCDMQMEVSAGRVTGSLWISDRELRLEEFSGVYARLMESADIPENKAKGRGAAPLAQAARSAIFHAVLSEWIEVADCCVVNRGAAMASNVSKPYQAQLISRAGFATPTTLISNNPAEVQTFARAHGRVIYKSISAVRSIVKELEVVGPERSITPACLHALQRIKDLPTQFQAFVPGVNIRVHVAGSEVFATEIDSAAVDYRYAGSEGLDVAMSAVTLPSDIVNRCLHLSKSLSLPLCGIDLKRTPAEEYFCFEVNPSPAYSYYEKQSGQPIAQAIVQLLTREDLKGRHDASH